MARKVRERVLHCLFQEGGRAVTGLIPDSVRVAGRRFFCKDGQGRDTEFPIGGPALNAPRGGYDGVVLVYDPFNPKHLLTLYRAVMEIAQHGAIHE